MSFSFPKLDGTTVSCQVALVCLVYCVLALSAHLPPCCDGGGGGDDAASPADGAPGGRPGPRTSPSAPPNAHLLRPDGAADRHGLASCTAGSSALSACVCWRERECERA